MLKMSLLTKDLLYFQNSCLSMPKLQTYVKINYFNEEKAYLHKPISFIQRAFIAKFKLGILPIRIETGRFARPYLPENERTCLQCNSFSIENESHFALYCSKHFYIREAFINSLKMPIGFQSDEQFLKHLSTNALTIKPFGQYLIDCFTNRKN